MDIDKVKIDLNLKLENCELTVDRHSAKQAFIIECIEYFSEYMCLHNFLEWGCGSGRMISRILNSNRITPNNILGLDIDEESLLSAYKQAEYEFKVFLDNKNYFKRVKLDLRKEDFESNVVRLKNVDVISSVEVIEHVDYHTVSSYYLESLLEINPKLIFLTTPNYEYNAVIKYEVKLRELNPDMDALKYYHLSCQMIDENFNDIYKKCQLMCSDSPSDRKELRLKSHKYELTRQEFIQLIDDKMSNDYEIIYFDFGKMYKVDKVNKLGRSSQIAILINKKYIDIIYNDFKVREKYYNKCTNVNYLFLCKNHLRFNHYDDIKYKITDNNVPLYSLESKRKNPITEFIINFIGYKYLNLAFEDIENDYYDMIYRLYNNKVHYSDDCFEKYINYHNEMPYIDLELILESHKKFKVYSDILIYLVEEFKQHYIVDKILIDLNSYKDLYIDTIYNESKKYYIDTKKENEIIYIKLNLYELLKLREFL